MIRLRLTTIDDVSLQIEYLSVGPKHRRRAPIEFSHSAISEGLAFELSHHLGAQLLDNLWKVELNEISIHLLLPRARRRFQVKLVTHSRVPSLNFPARTRQTNHP